MLTDAASRQPPLECGRRFPSSHLRPRHRIEAADQPFVWTSRAYLSHVPELHRDAPPPPRAPAPSALPSSCPSPSLLLFGPSSGDAEVVVLRTGKRSRRKSSGGSWHRRRRSSGPSTSTAAGSSAKEEIVISFKDKDAQAPPQQPPRLLREAALTDEISSARSR